MNCCNCGKELRRDEAYPMIYKTTPNFGKYCVGDYFCCNKCDAKWQEIKGLYSHKIETSMKLGIHETWLYLFFEYFLCENPSRRKLCFKT